MNEESEAGISARAQEFPVLVVGIGAQAGGVGAIQEFFTALDEGAGMAFVLCAPIARDREELIALLRRLTALAIRELRDGERLAPDHVYIPPASTTLGFDGDVARTLPAHDTDSTQSTLDQFFGSLADAFGPRAVGLIMSGPTADGAVGIQRISNAGGMTLAEDPEHAAHPTQPRAAIATGAVDHVLRPTEMAQVLLAYVGQAGTREDDDSVLPESEAIVQALGEICDLLERATDHNFKHYKTNTLVRRIRRRMHVLHVKTVEDYVDRLRREPEQLNLLFRELLIGVTAFFRDPDAFDTLIRDVLSPMVRQRPGGQLRIWVPGCATGEEAYSLAIAVRELMSDMSEPPDVQIFATDIDERALSIARQAVYPAGVAEQMSAERLERFFSKRGKLLELRGFEISTAHSGAEAIELAPGIVPHAVVLDIGLPDLDGFEVVARLKEIPVLSQTRYIALSGHDLSDERDSSRRAEFDAQFVKPANVDRLVMAIEPSEA